MDFWSERIRSPLFITRIASFTAIGVVVGLMLMAVPNVELVSAVCFASGFLLGPTAGFLCGALTEALYAGFHPMGSTVGFVLLAQVAGMSIVGLLGAAARLLCGSGYGARYFTIVPLSIGVATLQFDLLTNLAFALMAGFSFSQTAAALLTGLPFAAIHLVSNLTIAIVILLPLLPKLIRALVLS